MVRSGARPPRHRLAVHGGRGCKGVPLAHRSNIPVRRTRPTMAAALWLWLCVGAVVNVGRADAAALRVARAEDKSGLKYYEPVFTG